MEKPKFELKPSIPNAIIPLFLKNAVRALPLLFLVWLLAYGLSVFSSIGFKTLFVWSILLYVLFILVSLLWRVFILRFTRYSFYADRVVREFRFIRITKQSTFYSRIASVNTIISLWDRLCNAGDITLHTAEDSSPDLVLAFIPNPQQIEHKIYQLTKKTIASSETCESSSSK